MRKNKKTKIGFIGQGWIGKNYADDFKRRGYEVVRYSAEPKHQKNKEKIAECDFVFIAVPTPTTPKGFDDSILREVVKLVGKGKVAVIKSTLIPGTTESIQAENPEIVVMHSPEFLTEATAKHDAANPNRNIVGVPELNTKNKKLAKVLLGVLPKADYELICNSNEAELIKYGGNNWFFFKVVYVNLLYDVAQELGADWNTVRDAMSADPRVGKSHLMPVHASGTLGSDNFKKGGKKKIDGGRGAGGHCFIKDFAAFTAMYEETVGDEMGKLLLHHMQKKNNDLLKKSNKDLDLLKGVHGETI